VKPEAAMRLALAQARGVLGRTFPNPAVGAVLFRGDTVLARGVTKPPGGPHAEAVAIAKALRAGGKASLRGASIATTLEPCCFTGRTGPCTEAIIEAGIRKVFIGCRDPHKRVSGRGIRALRRAGVEVVVGVLEDECRAQHRGFFSLCEKGRPFVTLKLATTLDGKIATAKGESRWITGEASRAWVHQMRARSDAVMVGSGTAVADDPELTVRGGARASRNPVRVLVDSKLRLSPKAKLYKGLAKEGDETRGARAAGLQTWVLCQKNAKRAATLAKKGARVIEVPLAGRNLDLAKAFKRLGDLGLTTVFVEGGGELAAALIRANLVDEIHWLQAPTLIGSDGRPALGPLSTLRLRDATQLVDIKVRRRGEDIHTTAKVATRMRKTRR